MFGDLGKRGGPGEFFFFAHFVAGDQAAKIAVAGLIFDQQRQADKTRRKLIGKPWRATCLIAKIDDGDFRTDMAADLATRSRGMKTRPTVDAIAVEQGDGGHAEVSGGFSDFFGKRGALKEAESGSGMEFDVHQS